MYILKQSNQLDSCEPIESISIDTRILVHSHAGNKKGCRLVIALYPSKFHDHYPRIVPHTIGPSGNIVSQQIHGAKAIKLFLNRYLVVYRNSGHHSIVDALLEREVQARHLG
jgi:hypothetical protein